MAPVRLLCLQPRPPAQRHRRSAATDRWQSPQVPGARRSILLVSLVLAPIGEYIDDLTGANRLLQAFPVIGVIQLAMQLVEQLALLHIGKQEWWKLLGEHIQRC